MKRWISGIVVLMAALGGLYWWLWLDHRLPQSGDYAIDIAEVRRLAGNLRGPKPDEVRFEHVATLQFTRGMIATGDGWSLAEMPVYAWQLRYPDRSLVIDTAMDRSLAKPDFILSHFDDAAYARVERSLDEAALIVITHEHFDHSGGLARHPRLDQILPKTRLSESQIGHLDRMAPASIPEALMAGYNAVRYLRYHALAPGVVLIAAPGHTPGSQMVYVQLADGRELLFLGDVAWKQRNVDGPRQRPRFVTALLIREEREAVYAQLQALNRLAREVPDIRQIPGHGATIVDALVARGEVQAGFVLP